MYYCSDLRKGIKIEIDDVPHAITKFQFVKPGKGQALYKCRLKNMLSGAQFDRTFRSGDKFNEANLEEAEMEYLYSDGEQYCFMHTSTYEQHFLLKEQVAEVIDLLKENTVCSVLFYKENAIGVSLPMFIELQIIKADPWVKGDTATGSTKPATLETGFIVQVPPFIEKDEFVRIDTRTSEYVERVK